MRLRDRLTTKGSKSSADGIGEIATLIESEFNAQFYARQLGKPVVHQDELVRHYIDEGWKAGLNPSKDFDTFYYLAANPDVKSSGINPYYHYLRFGRSEGRIGINRLGNQDKIITAFDAEFYKYQLNDQSVIDTELLSHYLEVGWKMGLNPNPWFNTNYYSRVNTDVSEARIHPFEHFVNYGYFEGRWPSEYAFEGAPDGALHPRDLVSLHFDAVYYLEQSPSAFDEGLLEHYFRKGWKSGLNPTRYFNTNFYLSKNRDIAGSGSEPFVHYLRIGRLEGRKPSADYVATDSTYELRHIRDVIAEHFDADFYLQQNRAIYGENIEPLTHFINIGWRLFRDPNAWFSTEFYLSHSPECIRKGINPLFHFLTIGKQLGLPFKGRLDVGIKNIEDAKAPILGVPLIRPFVDKAFYYAAYTDVAKNNLDPADHYFSFGWLEGRDPSSSFSTQKVLYDYPWLRDVGLNPLVYTNVLENTSTKGIKFQDWSANPAIGRDLQSIMRALRLVKQPLTRPDFYDRSRLKLNWIIPDFDIGGGGHMTIFRMIKWLEIFGHDCAIWVNFRTNSWDDDRRNEILISHFQTVRARVQTLSLNSPIGDCDALIATGWDTAYTVQHAPGNASRVYFVQDYEPSFYAIGTRYLAALETYSFEFGFICAGHWLQNLIINNHLGWARSFELAYDEIYCAAVGMRTSNEIARIAFYGREGTSRRLVELGLMALERLAARGRSFEVCIFGSSTTFGSDNFSVLNLGVCPANELANLYQSCDVGLCFSGTNYSLVPIEMMACGLPVIEIDGESTRAAYPPGVAFLASPRPDAIAAAIERFLDDASLRAGQVAKATLWLSNVTWERSARAVENALLDRLKTLGSMPSPTFEPAMLSPPIMSRLKCSVFIPTMNGGSILREVVERVLSQHLDGGHELILVDSESEDGSVEAIRQEFGSRIRVEILDRKTFQHGRTRNFAASLGRGEFLSFLTQDALPVDNLWLSNFVTMMDRHPRAAGGYGRHQAWPNASAYARRDIKEFFDSMGKQPLAVSKFINPEAWRANIISHRQFLHYFSDNNSILRRSCWERIPYPEVEFGEDQAWADLIIQAGFWKVYAPLATVYHSHDYNPLETFDRARTEAGFFADVFGYNTAPDDPIQTLNLLNAADERWGHENGLNKEEINRRKSLNKQRINGAVIGYVDSMPL